HRRRRLNCTRSPSFFVIRICVVLHSSFILIPHAFLFYYLSLRVEVFFTESARSVNKKNFLQRFSELSGVASSCRQRMDASTEECFGERRGHCSSCWQCAITTLLADGKRHKCVTNGWNKGNGHKHILLLSADMQIRRRLELLLIRSAELLNGRMEEFKRRRRERCTTTDNYCIRIGRSLHRRLLIC
ncbi:hypothetical protein M513_13690, partial [Trichuris suis]